VRLLVLVLALLAIRTEKRARSFCNCSVPASVAAERAVFSITSTISSFGIWVKMGYALSRLGRPPSFRKRGTMAALLARRSKGQQGRSRERLD
jgi:hypothetical protein